MSESVGFATGHMRKRALKACSIVAAMLVLVCVIDVPFDAANGSAEQGSSIEGIDSQVLVRADNPFETLDQVEAYAAVGKADVPESFAREIGLLPNARDVRVDSTGTVVGYAVDGDCMDVLGKLTAHMEERGWVPVSLGAENGATFLKEDGECKWSLITCDQVDQATSVVVRSIYT